VQCKRCDILVGDVTRGGYLSLIRRLEFDYTLIFFVCGRFIAVSGADKILHKAIIYPFDWPREGKFPTAGHRRVSFGIVTPASIWFYTAGGYLLAGHAR